MQTDLPVFIALAAVFVLLLIAAVSDTIGLG